MDRRAQAGTLARASHPRCGGRAIALAAAPERTSAAAGPLLGGLDRPGLWFALALALGALLRLYLVVFTEGTTDVSLWADHARGVAEQGLPGYYRSSPLVNHPPPVLRAMALLHALCGALGLPFRVGLRLPFALLDLATALLLLRSFAGSRWRFAVCAAWWLNPVAILFSSFHGNTDSSVACMLLACVLLVTAGRAGAAGALFGFGTWIKLPVVLGAPVLFLALRGGARRRFLLAGVLVAAAGYLPVLAQDPALVASRVFGYGGMLIRTHAGVDIWGIQVFYGLLDFLPRAWWPALARGIELGYILNGPICLALVGLFALLDARGERSARGLGRSVAACFVILYGVTNVWAFQYLAWSVPFWFHVGPRFAAASSLLLGAYVYAVYALACGNPFLMGTWNLLDFAWPTPLLWLRNACVLLCSGAALGFLVDAARARTAK